MLELEAAVERARETLRKLPGVTPPPPPTSPHREIVLSHPHPSRSGNSASASRSSLTMPDPFLDAEYLPVMESISHLHTLNPFEPAWEALQQATLGGAYVPAGAVSPAQGTLSKDIWRLLEGRTTLLSL